VRPDAPAADLSSADLSNVVPFARPRPVWQAPAVRLPDTAPAAQAGVGRERARFLALAALSLAVHGGALWMLALEPEPLASIGEQVISVEIVVGATAPAGIAQAPSQSEAQASTPESQQADPPQETEQVATAQPQQVPVAAEEKAPQEKQPEQTETPPETTVAEESTAQEETPRETSRDTEVTLVPPIEKKPSEPRHAPKPVHHAKPAREPRRVDAPTKQHAQKQAKAAPATAANNVGVGRSNNNSNYAGLVSAHLRRHQQYPADARSRGQQGTATVTFALDGGGRVTSARLVRGSGIASIDQEVQAMVHRASPFPAPPSHHAVSFTVPVSFRLN
jgi:protein TonB